MGRKFKTVNGKGKELRHGLEDGSGENFQGLSSQGIKVARKLKVLILSGLHLAAMIRQE
jgi:hypothetical protein